MTTFGQITYIFLKKKKMAQQIPSLQVVIFNSLQGKKQRQAHEC